MKKIIIGIMVLLMATLPDTGSGYQPCCRMNCNYYSCQQICVQPRDYVIARFTGNFWDPVSQKMVFAQMSVEPAEYLDIPPVSPLIVNY